MAWKRTLLVIAGALTVFTTTQLAADELPPQRVAIAQIDFHLTDAETDGVSISLANMTDQLVNLEGWVLEYASSDASLAPEDCQAANWRAYGTDDQTYTLELAGGVEAGKAADITGPDMMSADQAGSLRLLSPYQNNTSVMEDLVGWRVADQTPPCAESAPAIMSQAGLLIRVSADGRWQDTNDNSVDFGSVATEPDTCPNLADHQSELPAGYWFDGASNCRPPSAIIEITELLPNAAGVDDGNEFIELYNPGSATVDLAGYQLLTGLDLATERILEGLSIEAGQYLVLKDDQVGFRLTNTKDKVGLRAPDGVLVSQTDAYQSAADDMAWAKMGGGWVYTNRPTPGSANQASLTTAPDAPITPKTPDGYKPCAANQYRNPVTNRCKLKDSSTSGLVPCRDGQYRNPETNRCRQIVTASSNLKPCAPDQQRNPETNRCRKIASTSQLKPCAAGQERNPATNRCRKVDGYDGLKPCVAGQQRNPATNRCRKVIDVAGATTTGVVDPTAMATTGMQSMFGPMAMAATGFAVLGYGAYEWRSEIAGWFRRIFRFGSS